MDVDADCFVDPKRMVQKSWEDGSRRDVRRSEVAMERQAPDLLAAALAAAPRAARAAAAAVALGEPMRLSVCGKNVQLSEDATVATKLSGWGLAMPKIAICKGDRMEAGRHYAEFTFREMNQPGRGCACGVIRPDCPDLEFPSNHDQDAWAFQTSNTGSDAAGHLQHRGVSTDWPGRETAEAGDVIGLLLDLGQGSLTAYKNGSRLGCMKESGLTGPLCWFVQVENTGDSVQIKAPLGSPA